MPNNSYFQANFELLRGLPNSTHILVSHSVTSGQINFVLQKISRSETIARLKPIGEKVRMIQI